jgi:hypothetical protein
MKTKYTTLTFNGIEIEVQTTYEWRTDYPDCPNGFWQETKREIVSIDLSELEKFVDKAKIEL